MLPMTSTSSSRDAVWQFARTHAYDAYVATLLAPSTARDDLMTLAAVFADIGRVPLEVADTPLGEIRLQWWRDQLKSGVLTGHPIADQMIGVCQRRALPLPLLEDALDGYAERLYAAPFDSAAELDANILKIENASSRLKQLILQLPDTPAPEPWLNDAALAIGLTHTLVHVPQMMAMGRWPLLSQDITVKTGDSGEKSAAKAGVAAQARRALALIGEVRRGFAQASPATRHQVLGLALAEPYLRALTRSGHDPLRDIVGIAPVKRLWRLWRASRLGWL